MIPHGKLHPTALLQQIKNRTICWGGNAKLKIYGRLNCRSGKRMKRSSRVFFATEQEAIALGFRPCGHCMNTAYKTWKMNLFDSEPSGNLLPYDGTVHYYEKGLPPDRALYYFDRLFDTIEWKNDEVVIFGRHIVTKRKTAWYGDLGYLYTYSNTTKRALSWTKELLELRRVAEELSGASFNACLLNLYHNGEEGMSWHSDDESSLAGNSSIASFSLGAARNFSFRHKKTKESRSILLGNGSLLVMKDETQKHWQHALPKSKKILQPRLNLTFRTMLDQADATRLHHVS